MAATSKSKSAASNAVNKKAAKPENGTAVPAAAAAPTKSTEITLADYGSSGKPERSIFDKEQEKIKTEIEALQVKLVDPLHFHFWIRTDGMQ